MTTWTECREKVQMHSAFIKWRQKTNGDATPSLGRPIGPPCPGAQTLKMARMPNLKAVSFDDLARKYGAIEFQDVLADFIAQTNHPTASGATLRVLASDTLIPFRSVPVYHRIKYSNTDGSEIVNSVHIRPEQKDSRGRQIPSRFDTALVCGKSPSQDRLVHGTDGESSATIFLNASNFTIT